jgi:dihydroorotase
VDFGLAAHVWPDHLDDLAALWHDGISFFKIFTCDTHGIPGLATDLLLDSLGLLAGLGAAGLIHCEDGPITAAAQHRLQRLGRDDPWILPEWRSREAELVATTTVCLLTRLTGARTTVAHASCAEVVEVVNAAAAAGADVVAESCPQYLLLAEAEIGEHAALRKFTPPARIRTSRDGDRMWAALDDRHIHHLSSDHAPSTRAQKADGSIWDAHFGLPGLDTTAPLLIDAALSGRVPLERVVEAYATAPARRYRLRGKGDLLPGCDGDLVLIDPGARWELGDSRVRSKAGWTPYAGRVVRGKVAGSCPAPAPPPAGDKRQAMPEARPPGRPVPGRDGSHYDNCTGHRRRRRAGQHGAADGGAPARGRLRRAWLRRAPGSGQRTRGRGRRGRHQCRQRGGRRRGGDHLAAFRGGAARGGQRPGRPGRRCR